MAGALLGIILYLAMEDRLPYWFGLVREQPTRDPARR